MARKRKGAAAVEGPRLRRLHCAIDADLHARLGAYAAWCGLSVGAVVSRAIAAEMGRVRFTVYCAPPGGSSAAGHPSPALLEAPGGSPEVPEVVPMARMG
jgi:hypothetical protein